MYEVCETADWTVKREEVKKNVGNSEKNFELYNFLEECRKNKLNLMKRIFNGEDSAISVVNIL